MDFRKTFSNDKKQMPKNIPDSALRRLFFEFAENKVALVGLIIFTFIFLAAIFSPMVSPQNPYDLKQLSILDNHLPPGSRGGSGMTYWLGTDAQGRDILSGILYGLRTSIFVAVLSAFFALIIGGVAGMLGAYIGGWVDALIMRTVDLQLGFPAILIALILLAILGKGVDKIILALIVTQWAYYARTVRGAVLVEKNKEYIEAATGLALSTFRIVFRHLLPNCLPPLIIVATMRVAYAISLEATLSFLGIGLPVTEPSLGLLIANGSEYLLSGKYWMIFFPGLSLLITIVSINLVADHLRDILNPRLQT